MLDVVTCLPRVSIRSKLRTRVEVGRASRRSQSSMIGKDFFALVGSRWVELGRGRAGNGPICSVASGCKRSRARLTALGTTRIKIRSASLRAVPRDRQGRREPARDRTCIPHPASQVSCFGSAAAAAARDPSCDAAVPTRGGSGRGHHGLPQDTRPVMRPQGGTRYLEMAYFVDARGCHLVTAAHPRDELAIVRIFVKFWCPPGVYLRVENHFIPLD
jgi:hypothetical protein